MSKKNDKCKWYNINRHNERMNKNRYFKHCSLWSQAPTYICAYFFTYKSGTRFEFVLIDYAKYFCKSSLVLAEFAPKFREGNINN